MATQFFGIASLDFDPPKAKAIQSSAYYFHDDSVLYNNANQSILVYDGANQEQPLEETAIATVKTNIAQVHLGITFWVGGVSWLTQPLNSDVHVKGNVTLNVWMSSTDSMSLLDWSGYGGGLVDTDENGNAMWNNAPVYNYAHEKIISDNLQLYTISITNIDHVFPKGHKMGFVVGVGSTKQAWEVKVYFSSPDKASHAVMSYEDGGGGQTENGGVENLIMEGDLVANGRVSFHVPTISPNEFSLGFYDFDHHIRLMERDVHILCVYQTEVYEGKTYHYKITVTGENRIRCYVDQELLIDYTYALDTFDAPPWSDTFNDLAYTLSHTRHWYVGYVEVKNGILTLLPKPQPYDNTVRCLRFSVHPEERDKWKDYAVETYFMVINAPIEVLFRIFDDEHRIILYLDEGEVSIKRFYGLEAEKLGASESPITRGQWYHLRLEVKGQTFKVFINNEHVLTCEDSNLRLLTTGGVGVSVSAKCEAKFICGLLVNPI
jgi:hypothetical protein